MTLALLFSAPFELIGGRINNAKNGRGERIRTSDSCVPNAVLYQAELHPEADWERVSNIHTTVDNTHKKNKREI